MESILVIEENQVVQSLLNETFQRKGFHVLQALTPEAGLRMYAEKPSELVIMNTRFATGDSLRLLFELKRTDSDVAVIILTQHADLEIAHRALGYGIYDIIFLPFELDQVVNTVGKALEKKMLLERNRNLIEKQAALIERLHTSYKQLKELDKLKTDFLANISHELLTPLTSIKALTFNLLRGIVGELDPRKREYAELIREDADRLEEILKDILNFSQLEAGKVRLKKEVMDVRPIINKVARSLRPVANQKGLELETNGENELPAVPADANRLEEILDNLVFNAIKYTPSGGRITISADEDPENLRVSVRDTGIGIAKEHMDKVFSKFVQFAREQGPGTQGVGLGLAIVKKLVQLHGGRIFIESELRKGTTFTFTLPKKGALEQKQEA